jgi:hypothetical protein
MSVSALLLSLAFFLPSPAEVLIVQFSAKSRVTLPLGGKSKADVQRLATNTKIVIRLEDLRSPQSVLPGMNTYVAWAVSPEGSFDNLGELEVSGAKGHLEATTRFDRFALLITAEPHYMVDAPSARVVLKNEAERSISSAPLKIEVGAYEYSGLPTNPGSVPVLVMEARAAFAIAAAAHANRRDDPEFRQALVTLEAMEELFKRTSPADVISAAANAAIRQGQRAAKSARQSAR